MRIFSVVAKEGNFTKAAGALHTVQSNVTARIKHLELEVGTTLFVRRKGGVVLTPAGKMLLEHASKILRLADFDKQFPNVEISLSTGTTAELVHAVLSYELERAFVAGSQSREGCRSRSWNWGRWMVFWDASRLGWERR